MQFLFMYSKVKPMIKKNIENELSSGARRVTGFFNIGGKRESPSIIYFEAEETRANQADVAELKGGESVGQLLTLNFIIYVIR